MNTFSDNGQKPPFSVILWPLEGQNQKLIHSKHSPNKLCPLMGTIYPRSDHYPLHPEISNKDFYFVCYTGGNSSGKKLIEPRLFTKSSGNTIFGQIFGHQRAKNEARNTKMHKGQETHPLRINARYRGQETHPIRINARYEINWDNSFFKKFRKPHFRPNIWPPEGRKWG